MKSKRIKIPIYDGNLVIIFDKDLKKVEKKYDTTPLDKCDGVVFQALDGDYVVALSTNDPSIICHETIHLVNRLFNNRGVELDIDNDEPQAYMAEWFFKQINDFINK